MQHKNTLKLSLIFAIIFTQCSTAKPIQIPAASANQIPVVDDGISIQKPGVFYDKCYYGKDESLSDHAPVIYQDLATWNVAAPINPYKIQPDPKNPKEFFFNHKFFTDDNGNLVNRAGLPVSSSGTSEVILLRSQNTPGRTYPVATQLYVDRMKMVIEKIQEFFKENQDLNYMVLQEIPNSDEKTQGGENLQALIRAFFQSPRNDLAIVFYDATNQAGKIAHTAIAKTKFKKDMMPDLAIVYRAHAPSLVQEAADHDNRFAAWCAAGSKTCFVAVHMPFALTSEELKIRCTDMKNMATALFKKGYLHIKFAGDFNTFASRMADVCSADLTIPDAKSVGFRTSQGEKPNSCGSNQGHQGQYNIDVRLDVQF